MKFASIIPLIGGETIAMEQVFGTRPDYILSYDAFKANDSHLLNWYNHEVPYHLLDDGGPVSHDSVAVVNSVCPCAGLSSLSTTASSDNPLNEWMIKSTDYVLTRVKPEVLWGENAPRLSTNMGKPVVDKLRAIAKREGYTFSLYKTKSILHGLSQVRERSFYFFWKGDRVPIFNFFLREPGNADMDILAAKTNYDDPMWDLRANQATPSETPYYGYILNEIEGGISHREFYDKIDSTSDVMNYLEDAGHTYGQVADWMEARGITKGLEATRRNHEKVMAGKALMRRNTIVPKGKIGAFVGHLPLSITHPYEDRFINVRESLHLMRMPRDFQLLGGTKNVNHICQNVPVTTAADMATEVREYLMGRRDSERTDFVLQNNINCTTYVESKAVTLDEFV